MTDIEQLLRDYYGEIRIRTLAQQRAKVDTYAALTAQNLPIPPDLKAEVEAHNKKSSDG